MATFTDLARMPLFERLADADPQLADEARPLRMLDRAGLQASVGRELLRMLNRRSTPRGDAPLTVLDYGLPDWTGLYAANPDDRLRIARGMLRAILAFEPRLGEPRVEVEPSASGQQVLRVRLSGRLRAGHTSWPVLFDIKLDPFGASMPPAADGIP
jgi:type VI secretion system lysozyme-like protein